LLSGCGPSEEEAARAVMMATPIVYLAGMGIMALMLFLWRKLEPRLGINWRPVLLGLALACVIGLLSIVGVTTDPPPDTNGDSPWGRATTDGIPGVVGWLGIAIIFYGTSYLALLLVSWRIWLWRRPATAFTWAWVPVLFVMLAPCATMIMFSGNRSDAMRFFAEAVVGLWGFPGFMGMVTVPLLLIALTEVWVRVRIIQRKRNDKPVSSSSVP